MNESEIRKRLNKFSKAQIIEGIIKTYTFPSLAERLLSNLEYIETCQMIDDHRDAIDQESIATKKYIEWRDNMIQKYGTDDKVRLSDIPPDELIKGAELERRMRAAREKERRLSDKIDNIFLKDEVE